METKDNLLRRKKAYILYTYYVLGTFMYTFGEAKGRIHLCILLISSMYLIYEISRILWI